MMQQLVVALRSALIIAAVCVGQFAAAEAPPRDIFVSPVSPPNGLPVGSIGHPYTSLADAFEAAASLNGQEQVRLHLDAAPGRATHRVREAVVVDGRHDGLAIGTYVVRSLAL